MTNGSRKENRTGIDTISNGSLSFDQVGWAIDELKNNPNSRRAGALDMRRKIVWHVAVARAYLQSLINKQGLSK